MATDRQQRIGAALSNTVSLVREASIAVEQRHNFRKRRCSTLPGHLKNTKRGKETSWTQRFFCLSETDDDYVPMKKGDLVLAGLGERLITIPNIDCSPAEFHQIILNEFPKLREGGGIEFLKCTQSTRRLEPIPFTVSHSPRLLKSLIGAARVFVRPIQVSLDLTPAKDKMVSIAIYAHSFILRKPMYISYMYTNVYVAICI